MTFSPEPMDDFSRLAKVYLFDKTKPLIGFGDRHSIFKVRCEFCLKHTVCGGYKNVLNQ